MIKSLSIILTAAAISGCSSYKTKQHTIPLPHYIDNLADNDGSKGKFPPGRNSNNQTLPKPPRKVINYQGHGIGYESHAQHHHHHNQIK